MPWWLVPALLIGGAAAIRALFDDKAQEARERWEAERENLEEKVEEYRQHIEQHLAQAQSSYDFHVLTQLHYASMRVADHAHKLLNDARASLDAMGKMLVAAKEKRSELFERKRAAATQYDKNRIQEEINQVSELRALIFPDKDAVKAQRDRLQDELRRLNAQTRVLKLAIRDRCGRRGADWYAGREAKAASRRRQGR